MKKFFATIFLTGIVFSAAFAVDFGGLVNSDSSFQKQGTGDFAFTQKLDASAYLQIPFGENTMLSAEALYRFQYAESEIDHYLNLPLLKVNYSSAIGAGFMDIAAGRFTMADTTGKVFNQTSDGLYASLNMGTFSTSLYFGYTGLVNRFFVSMIEDGIFEYAGFKSDFYTSSLPYLAVGVDFGMPNLFLNQNMGAGVWAFVGIQKLKSNKIYGNLTINGPIVASLFHTTEGIFSTVITDEKAEFGGLASTRLNYYFDWLNSSVGAGFTYASEKFQTVTKTSGMVTGDPWTNLLLPSVSLSILPVGNLYVGTEASVALSADEMDYQGAGLIGTVSYQLFSDVSFGVTASQFFAKDKENNDTKISINAAISF